MEKLSTVKLVGKNKMSVEFSIDDEDVIAQLEKNLTIDEVVEQWPNEQEVKEYKSEVINETGLTELVDAAYEEAGTTETFLAEVTSHAYIDEIIHFLIDAYSHNEILECMDKGQVGSWLMGNTNHEGNIKS